MEKSSFFNAVETSPGVFDRVYKAETFAAYFSKFIGNGVFPNPSTGLQVLENTSPDMTVLLAPGSAYINGYTYENDVKKAFAIKVADGVLNRKDAIFVRFDNAGRAIMSLKIEGTPGVDAVPPKVVRTADYWDLCVGVINVKAGITKITQDLIEDTRMDNSVCGIVHAVVDQIDTTTLYEQIKSDLKYFKDVSQADFNKWFDEIKDKLGNAPATNLQNQIDNIVDGTTKVGDANKLGGVAAVDYLQKTGDASNVTAKFSQASMRANLTTGEKLSVSFGKVMKWFADLKAVAFSGNYNDLSNKPAALKNPSALTLQMNGSSSQLYDGSAARTFNVTPAAINAFAKSDIIPVEKGGTGVTRVLDIYTVLKMVPITVVRTTDVFGQISFTTEWWEGQNILYVVATLSGGAGTSVRMENPENNAFVFTCFNGADRLKNTAVRLNFIFGTGWNTWG